MQKPVPILTSPKFFNIGVKEQCTIQRINTGNFDRTVVAKSAPSFDSPPEFFCGWVINYTKSNNPLLFESDEYRPGRNTLDKVFGGINWINNPTAILPTIFAEFFP